MADTRKQILNCLRRQSGNFLSGAILSNRLQISRAAVWKQVQMLRRSGYIITARPRLGYRLDGEPDRLSLETDPARRLFFYPVVDSTNRKVRQLAEAGEPGGAVVIADRQLKGRGRRGRHWESPPGLGLWFSLLLRPVGITPSEAAPVTLVTAAVLARVLNSHTGLPVGVKWPNDLLVNNRKVGGILTELQGEPDRIDYLVIGIGLNVNHCAEHFPPELAGKATSLYLESGRRYDRTTLFYTLRNELECSYERFFKEGFRSFRQLWKEFSTGLGRPVSVQWSGGQLQGLAVDLGPNGALLVKDHAGQLHQVSYGEIDQQ